MELSVEQKIGLRPQAATYSPSAALALSLVASAGHQREPALSWGEVTNRVTAYWRALGVTDAEQLTALTRRVMQRVDALEAETAVIDLAIFSIEETLAMLDEWLASVLEFDHKPLAQELAMARVALLSGATPDWAAALLSVDQRALVAALPGALTPAVPAPAGLPMEPQRIDLFSLNLLFWGRRCLHFLWVSFGKLFTTSGKR
jgi:hypothetical protein